MNGFLSPVHLSNTTGMPLHNQKSGGFVADTPYLLTWSIESETASNMICVLTVSAKVLCDTFRYKITWH